MNAEQRIKDLYIVNSIAGWAKGRLKILGEMAERNKISDWYVTEVQRIQRDDVDNWDKRCKMCKIR